MMKLFCLFVLWVQVCAAMTVGNLPKEGRENALAYEVPKDFSNGALKESFLERLKDLFEVSVFIESGTFLGNTTFAAARVFKTVHSIEVSPEFYRKALRRLGKLKHVELHLGDSGDLLGSILSRSRGKTLFYLDGHYDGGKSGRGIENTPIWRELEAIRQAGMEEAVILIDDLCDFQESRYPERIVGTCFEGYPTLREIVGHLLEINPRYRICFLGNGLLAFVDDVGVSAVVRSCAIDRLSDEFEIFSEAEIERVEERIARAEGAEREELIRYFDAYSAFEWERGWRSYASFWRGLMLASEGNVGEARRLFELSAMHGLPGWRTEHYIGR